jgi:DNA repair protein RadA/Sms
MLSSVAEKPFPSDAVAFGEIGLAGEIRQVAQSDRRLAEARSVGCKRAFVPYNLVTAIDGVELHRLRHVRDALAVIDEQW